jgi:hypothetical protein
VSVACHLEAGFVINNIDAFGEDFVTTVIEVRHTSTLHSTSVSAVFTNGYNLDTGFEYFYNHIEVNVGLVITPTGIKDIINFDGVGLYNLLKIVLDGYNGEEAVVLTVAVDVTFAVDLVDGEGGTGGNDGLGSVKGDDVHNVGDGGGAFDGHSIFC